MLFLDEKVFHKIHIGNFSPHQSLKYLQFIFFQILRKSRYHIYRLLLHHLIWKNYSLNLKFDMKSWIMDFCFCFTKEKTTQNNFSCKNVSVENNKCVKVVMQGSREGCQMIWVEIIRLQHFYGQVASVLVVSFVRHQRKVFVKAWLALELAKYTVQLL